MKIKFEDIGFNRRAAEVSEEAFLRERGWKHTCNTPGSFWLWEKMLPDGRMILAARGQAIDMQRWLDSEH